MDLLVRTLAAVVVMVVLVWLLPFELDWLIALLAGALVFMAVDGKRRI